MTATTTPKIATRRLWFLQVLATEQYERLAQENRVRIVESEPARGRMLDRNGRVIVDNKYSLAVTVDRQVVDTCREEGRVLTPLSRLLGHSDQGPAPRVPRRHGVAVQAGCGRR